MEEKKENRGKKILQFDSDEKRRRSNEIQNDSIKSEFERYVYLYTEKQRGKRKKTLKIKCNPIRSD